MISAARIPEAAMAEAAAKPLASRSDNCDFK